MFVFPITRPKLDRFAGMEPFEGQSFELVLCLLLSADQTLDIGFDSKSLGSARERSLISSSGWIVIVMGLWVVMIKAILRCFRSTVEAPAAGVG